MLEIVLLCVHSVFRKHFSTFVVCFNLIPHIYQQNKENEGTRLQRFFFSAAAAAAARLLFECHENMASA